MRTPTPVTRCIAVTALALLLAGCASTAAPVAEPRAASPTPTSSPTVSATPAPLPDRGTTPASIELEAIGLDARVLDVGAPDQVLEIPESPWDVGWWRDGVGVGGDHGTAVMVAHIASPIHGTGPLARAPELRGGEFATVTTADGTQLRYEVSRVDSYLKTVLPYAELFRQDGLPRIVLVTCGGTWDAAAGHYDSNVVVELNPVQ